MFLYVNVCIDRNLFDFINTIRQSQVRFAAIEKYYDKISDSLHKQYTIIVMTISPFFIFTIKPNSFIISTLTTMRSLNEVSLTCIVECQC